MVLGIWKSQAAEPPLELGDDASANALLECVVQEMLAGRSRADFVHELVRRRWQRSAATRFCQLAHDIVREVMKSPEQRAICARRGTERMQAAYGWIGSGLIMAIMLWMSGKNLQRFALWSLIIVGYGLVELISGLALWWPHKEFLPENEPASRNIPPANKPR